METELRNYGDGKTIVLHTKDSHVYRKFCDSVKVIRVAPYYQKQNGKDVLVGVDLYFLKKSQKWLERQLKPRPLKTSRFLASVLCTRAISRGLNF